MDRFRVFANLSTLANALVGVGAILYTLAGNKSWAMLLIVCGIGFDGLDGLFSRRSLAPSSTFGRVADSVADAVTFGLAPATLLLVHTDNASSWTPWSPWSEVVGAAFAALAIARLVYFTLRGFEYPHFVGAPTPQAALGVVTLGLLFDRPAFVGTNPLALLAGGLVVALLMVVPLKFPKIRRGNPLRPVATVTALALVAALLPLQFRPGTDSFLFVLAFIATLIAAAGILFYYVGGPLTLRGSQKVHT